MNAIEHNTYSSTWRDIGMSIGVPRAILVFSAHWVTYNETRISTQDNPTIIYDMIGFPQELYDVNYNPPGSPEIADEIVRILEDSYQADTSDTLTRSDEYNPLNPISLSSL